MSFPCSSCNRTFAHLYSHKREVHKKSRVHTCPTCRKPFSRSDHLKRHLLSHSAVRSADQPTPKHQRCSTPPQFKEKHVSRFRRAQCYTLSSDTRFADLRTLYKKTKDPLRQLLSNSLSELQMIKFDMVLNVNFQKATDPNETISCFFHSSTKQASTVRHLSDLILETFHALTRQVEDYLERGSGWVVKSIDDFDVHVSKYSPIQGSSYLPLSAKLRHRRAVINIKNTDSKCFMWSVLAALHPAPRNPKQVSYYEECEGELNFTGIDFPVRIEDIGVFEHLNSLSINVYSYSDEEDEIKVAHLTENAPDDPQVSLLLYSNQHYCWIKYPERFLRAETGKDNQMFQRHCCLKLFRSLQKRAKHTERCKEPDLYACEMSDDDLLKFNNYHKMQRSPYTIYADFECLLEKTNTCFPSPQHSSSTTYQQHTPCGYGIAEVFGCCSDNVKLGQTSIYRGEQAIQKFLDEAISWGERYQHPYNLQVPIEMSQQDAYEFNGTSTCNICKKPLGEERVADHCRFCGSYRGACHWNCNIQYRLSRDVVVILHNLGRYDGHLLLEKLGQVATQRKLVEIKVIPKGHDDYLTFFLRLRYKKTSWHLRFIDSYQFLSALLVKLVDNFHDKGKDRFTMMASHFQSNQLPLLLRKGVYPYD